MRERGKNSCEGEFYECDESFRNSVVYLPMSKITAEQKERLKRLMILQGWDNVDAFVEACDDEELFDMACTLIEECAVFS